MVCAYAYDAANIRSANTMTCFYTKKSVNGTMQNIPEFERTPRDSPTTNYMGILVVSLAIIINER